MTSTCERYARVSAQFAAKVAAVPDDGWDAPSPCEGWTALDLVRNVIDAHRQFLGLVNRELLPLPPINEDPAGAFAITRRQVLADLEDPARAALPGIRHARIAEQCRPQAQTSDSWGWRE